LKELLKNQKCWRPETMDRCRLCGRPLTDKESQRLGIGPICLKKLISYMPKIKRVIREEKAGPEKVPVIDGQVTMFDKEG
jgi:hypothetical protein